jgi:hypothetical protein
MNRDHRLFLAARRSAALVAVVLMAACATPVAPRQPGAVAECRAWLDRLDQQVDAHAVRDGAAHRPAGFPFVRVDRLLASFAEEAADDEARWQAWGERLLALDREARSAETAQLPELALRALAVDNPAAAMTRVQACGGSLWAALSDDPVARERLRRAAVVPDDYSAVLRTLGLYPLSRLPFYSGVQRELAHWQARWDAPHSTGDRGPLRYRLAGAAPDAAAAQWARSVPRDALGIPRPDADTARQLLSAHAPVLQIETTGRYDRPGRVRWGSGPAPEVDTADPVMYQRIAHTRFGNETLLQLVYSVWFTERPPRSGLDLLAGRVDGLVLRLTLSADGQVLMFDSIHNCGCYHVFVPAQTLRPKPAPSRQEWAFVPTNLPALLPGQRLRVRLSAEDHQVIGLVSEPLTDPDDTAVAYGMEDDNALRVLPTPQGARRSAFWSNGIMPGTERGERALFWPMGIESPGAMRQWGRHPTAFVGRRHFDDARLIEQRFEQLPAR